MPRRKQNAPRFKAGTLVGDRYRLVRYLARGGMAEVWLATHESLKCDVAIKFVDQKLLLEQEGAIERFRLEAQVSARLGTRTKHIVSVQDAGEFEGQPYLVMEYVPGRTLEDEIEDRGPLEPARFADLLDQVADALAAAHGMGIVHRDLKPSNLMLIDEPDGSTRLKVTDFGIAKALRPDMQIDRPKETSLGELVGSPAYMSPEQIGGERNFDARTDLWSLGVVTYEAITGRVCFEQGTLTELLMAISTRRYTPPSKVRADLPRAVDAWLDRALAVDPSQRFSSATEMAQAFRVAVSQPAGRGRAPLLMAGGAVVIGGIIAALLFGHRTTPAEPSAPASSAAPVTTASAATPPPQPSPPTIVPSVEATAQPTAEPRGSASSKVRTPPVKATATAVEAPPPTARPSVTTTPTASNRKFDKSEIQ